ncbi:MAG: transglycosylase domain-containing protein [Actinobacteria bacterium]|nr:transglycosylase domain-containing protein [Actinomycetota bacterium]
MDDDALELERLLAARRARLRRRPHSRARWLVSAFAVLVAILVGSVAAGAVGGRAALLDSCSLDELRPVALGTNSFLYAADGSLLGVVPSSTNRQPLELKAMSKWLPEATVAIEDRRFWQHGALDYQGIMRAFFTDIQQGRIAEGGSTITQELARNLYIGNAQRTLSRKLREACLAEKLSQRMSKSQILAAYLNEVFYGRHAYGAQAGAQTFFSTSADSLTLPQAALLAGLPQAPSTYDPRLHPSLARARRNEVLRAMFQAGDITRPQLRKATHAPLGIRFGSLYRTLQHPNFFGWAQQQLVQRFGAREVQGGGLQVTTTLDPRLQRLAKEAIAGVLKTPTDPAAALVAIDPRTGAVKAMLGYLPDERKMQFNLATQAHRTTGSSFKPITLATALQQGASVYSTFYGPPELFITDPQCATNGGPWDVHNNADETAGTMNLLDATANSVNTIYAQLVARVGVKNVVAMGHRLGIKSNLQAVCSITLGTQAITPLDLTTVYATFAANGIRHWPQAIRLVKDSTGRVLGRLQQKGTRVLSPNTAALIDDALEGVISHGTGTAANIGRPAAGKTGTAENYIDAWFCGYVPQLATCVWVGYPKAEIPLQNIEGVGSVYGGTLPAEIWHNFMAGATWRWPVEDFPKPTSYGSVYLSGSGTYGSSSWTSTNSGSTG